MFVVLLMMLHPTQEWEPPANPARFILRNKRREDFFELLINVLLTNILVALTAPTSIAIVIRIPSRSVTSRPTRGQRFAASSTCNESAKQKVRTRISPNRVIGGFFQSLLNRVIGIH